MAWLVNTVSADVLTPDREMPPADTPDEARNVWAAGRKSEPLLTDSANAKIYTTCQDLSQPACYLWTYTDGG